MAEWQEALDNWFHDHHGIITIATALQLGLSERTLYRMVARGQLVTLVPGVFRSRQWPLGSDQLMAAACARNPSATIAFSTAAKLWGFRHVRDNGIHVLVPHGASPELAGITVHRCRRIDAVDIVERADGVRLTSPPRTLFDSPDMLGFTGAQSVMEQILNERMCTLGTITDTFARLAHPNRPGTRTLTNVIRSRPKWRQALQSELEQKVLHEIERQGLPAPVTQCPVALPTGTLIHLDFGWPDWRVGLEVDDPAWHAGFAERHRDMRRDRKATTIGWVVPRVSKIDVDEGLREAVADVASIIAARPRVA